MTIVWLTACLSVYLSAHWQYFFFTSLKTMRALPNHYPTLTLYFCILSPNWCYFGEKITFVVASVCSGHNVCFWPFFRIFSVIFVVIMFKVFEDMPHSATSRAIGDDTSTIKGSNSGV